MYKRQKIECKEMGLEINMDKSEVMIVGGERKHKKTVAGMRVQPEIRYLWMQIDEKGSMGINFKKKVETTK